jgi:hypothetical protein
LICNTFIERLPWQLGEIEGFGKAKVERYGADILAVLARARDEAPAQVAAQSTEGDTGTVEEPPASPGM